MAVGTVGSDGNAPSAAGDPGEPDPRQEHLDAMPRAAGLGPGTKSRKKKTLKVQLLVKFHPLAEELVIRLSMLQEIGKHV